MEATGVQKAVGAADERMNNWHQMGYIAHISRSAKMTCILNIHTRISLAGVFYHQLIHATVAI